jgi:hypothetical protein
MASKPTRDDLVGWLKLQSPPSEETLAVYDECFDAALEDIESRISNVFVLSSGTGDLTDDDDYPQKVRTAIIMLSARLAKRSTSPEGVAGMSDIGAVVRILGNDPDIERLIRRFLKLDGFA